MIQPGIAETPTRHFAGGLSLRQFLGISCLFWVYVAVSNILRYLRYHEIYGKRQRAAELYQALPADARNLAQADLAAAEAACPHGLPIVELIHRAERNMG